MKVRFQRLARLEMGESARYYEDECPGLGDEFLNAVQRAVGFLKEHPEGAPVVSGTLRRKLLDRFPYGLIYAVEGDGIFVLAVANLRRRPYYWKGRSRRDK
jgi:hypothetical protein